MARPSTDLLEEKISDGGGGASTHFAQVWSMGADAELVGGEGLGSQCFCLHGNGSQSGHPVSSVTWQTSYAVSIVTWQVNHEICTITG
jgi:hypothetical protein